MLDLGTYALLQVFTALARWQENCCNSVYQFFFNFVWVIAELQHFSLSPPSQKGGAYFSPNLSFWHSPNQFLLKKPMPEKTDLPLVKKILNQWYCLRLRCSWVVRSNPVVVYGGSLLKFEARFRTKSIRTKWERTFLWTRSAIIQNTKSSEEFASRHFCVSLQKPECSTIHNKRFFFFFFCSEWICLKWNCNARLPPLTLRAYM
jgi:hypothetical protein